MKNILPSNKRALFGGLATMVCVGLGALLLGNISGYEAKELISASLPGLNMLCNTIVLASASILALLLTLLALSSSSESKIKKEYYESVLELAKFDTILFICALILFQLFNIPITESEEVPLSWFGWLYWISLGTSSILSGMMVGVILMLYGTISNIISIVGMGNDHPLIDNEDDN